MLAFTKMHGIGNDFVVVDTRAMKQEQPDWPKLCPRLLNRHFGIGADQLLLVATPTSEGEAKEAHYRMRIFNGDGLEAEMCGNGIRAVAKYLHKHEKSPRETFSLETLAGIQHVTICGDLVKVNMGAAKEKPRIVEIDNREIVQVNMGNPHAITFLVKESVDSFPLDRIGPQIEQNREHFPHGTNFEIVEFADSGNTSCKVRVWERSAGLTLACGSGACAVIVAADFMNLLGGKKELEVVLPGGTLNLSLTAEGHVIMLGPAVEVFSGEIEI